MESLATAKVRVRDALRRQPVDRCHRDIALTADAEERFASCLGVGSCEDIRQLLGVDVRHIYPRYRGPLRPPDGRLVFDEWGIGRERIAHTGPLFHGSYDEIAFHPLADAASLSDVHSHPWPDPDLWDYSAASAEMAAYGGRYWISSGAYSIFERAWGLMGMERLLTDLVGDPEIPLAVLDRVTEFYIQQTLLLLDACGGQIDQIETCDDVGTQRGMLISPACWREHIKPRQERFNRAVTERYDVRILYHSCGGIVPIIEDLIEIGVDILDPVQTRAVGMDPEFLKEEFGDRLCFHGGVDTQHTLPYGTAADVRAEVEMLEQALGRDGGYVLAPTHVIQVDVPPENILAVAGLAGAIHEEGLDAGKVESCIQCVLVGRLGLQGQGDGCLP